MCVVGAMILAGDTPSLLSEIIANVGEADFFQADHAIIYRVVATMHRAGKPVDSMLVREELERQKLMDEVGGIGYLGSILTSAPNAANGPHYAAIVREKATLRRLLSAANDAIRAVYEATDHDRACELARKFADKAAELATFGTTDPVVTLGEAAMDVLERRESPQVRRVNTGILTLDNLIGGLAKSKFTIVGADPRVGKSALIKQIGRNVSRRGVPFGLVTVEEDREKVAENMLASTSGVPNHRIAYGLLDKPDWERVEGAAAKLSGLPFYIDDTQQKLDDIVSAVERLATKYKCEVIGVDHLHLISCDAPTREREVSKISKALKAVFKRCNVAGVVAAQLNRGQDAKQKPALRNLRDSGSLEADGDCIMLLYREDAVRYQEDGYIPTRTIEVNVPKNKDGRMGEVPLSFSGETQEIGDPEFEDPFGV
jgi:replicative DNA helicase